jgi:PhoD-like phosphatase
MSTETDFMMDEAKCDARESSANAVGRIVIGHTTDTTVRIWVQGSSRYPRVRLAVRPAGQPRTDPVLEREGLVLKKQDYTACFDFDHLTASSTYEVTAFFTHWTAGCLSWPNSGRVTGVFKTFPSSEGAKVEPFSFLLGSCNLPVVAINNLAFQALQLVGFELADRSLERPIPERRPRPAPGERWWVSPLRWLMRQPWGRRPLGWLIHGSGRLVLLGTEGKWSKQPLLRSPFLKLAGMFAGYRIDFQRGRRAPLAGETLIGCRSQESGAVAFDPVVESGSWDDRNAQGFMILTDTRGGFQTGEGLRIRDRDPEDDARVSASSRFEPESLPEPARWLMRQPWGRWLLGRLIHYSLWLVFLRSRFLKLAGKLAGYRIDFRDGRTAPLAGQTLIGSDSKKAGVLAFDPEVKSGSWHRGDAQGFMILTDTRGGFRKDEGLRIRDRDPEDDASVSAISRFEPPDLPEPAFTIHAGDLIYYDFPDRDREPRLDSYRDTYCEGWFEDRFQRFFLARGPHYMTLDDHEIVDGFANDIELPRPYLRVRPEERPAAARLADAKDDAAENSSAGRRYLEAARPAYEEYVHSRHPDGPHDAQVSASSRFEPENLPEPARWLVRQPWGRWLLDRPIHYGLRLVFLSTGGAWSKQPLVRNRFLKLAGMFAGYRIDFQCGRTALQAGQTLIGSRSKESGVLACDPKLESGSWDDGNAQGFMILTDTRGGFQRGEGLRAKRDRDPLYYDFSHGAARFFVMDTRTGRRRDSDSRMIDPAQMKAFKEWLKSDKEGLKFVVSSVPFVAEVVRSEGTPEARDSSDDKWCGRPFRWQRDDIIDFIEEEEIERVVFLVGDMHCAYHASMSIGDPDKSIGNRHRWARRTVHELAGGPINQLDLGRQEQFHAVASLSTRVGRRPYQIRLHQFHGDASAVMHIQVTSAPARNRAAGPGVPEIVWRAIRTLTDPESQPDSEVQRDPDTEASRAKDGQPSLKRPKRIKDHPPISGRITFGRRCRVDQLPKW